MANQSIYLYLYRRSSKSRTERRAKSSRSPPYGEPRALSDRRQAERNRADQRVRRSNNSRGVQNSNQVGYRDRVMDG